MGTLFRNGPGLMEAGTTPLDQPFDGDGMVCAFTFPGDGTVRFRNRFVKTAGYVAEQKAGRMLFKGAFATGSTMPGLFNPLDFSVKNVANTHVVQWGSRLWALWEGGLPHELEPSTLDTVMRNGVAESTWDGAISGKGPFAAHFKVVTHSPDALDGPPRLVNFGAGRSGNDALITFYEFNSAGACIRKQGVTLPGDSFGFFHDMLVTPQYYMLFANPMRMDGAKLLTQYMFGRCSIAECLDFDSAVPLKIHVIARGGAKAGAEALRTFLAPTAFVFHHINAFEVNDKQQLVCDSIAWRAVDFSNNLKTLDAAYYGVTENNTVGTKPRANQRSELMRYTLDLSASPVQRAAGAGITAERVIQRPLEFPCVASSVVGTPYAHSYGCAAAIDHPVKWGPAQTIVKVTNGEEAAVWAPGPRCFTQEPVFVARPGATAEDDGWLLALVWNAERERTQLVILDAQRVAAGPVATITLRHAVPFGLHGSWTQAVHAAA